MPIELIAATITSTPFSIIAFKFSNLSILSFEGKLVFKHRFHSEQEASDYAQYRENLTMGHGIAFIIDPDVTKSVLEIR